LATGEGVVRLEGRIAVVTGAGSGIGRAIALGYAKEGASVVTADIVPERAAAVAAEIVNDGGAAAAVTVDVSRHADVEAMIETTVATYGRVDILAAVAGIATVRDFLELPEEEWDEVLDVNLKGQFLCGQEAARRMAQTGGGAILNITSQVAEVAQPMSAHYHASKGGAKMLTKAMALDLAPHRIRVNALAPGLTDGGDQTWMDTDKGRAWRPHREKLLERIPMHRAAMPDEMVGAAVFLVSDEASYVTGASLVVDGGYLVV
jgi:NAD(P)-dependent dehydrogenase (short-subunit alcohol dehydrogenase family)